MKIFWIRVFAVLLVAGGILGIGITLFSAYSMAAQHWLYAAMMVLFGLVFVYATYIGIQLWRLRTIGWKRAMLLFITQIPVFTVPGITYEWYTGLSFKLMGGAVEKSQVVELGSGFNMFLDTRITEISYGINIVALLAVAVLFATRRNFNVETQPHAEKST